MKTLAESLFDKNIIKKDIPVKKLLDILKGRVKSVTTATGVPLHKLFDIDVMREWKSKYPDDLLPTKRYFSKYHREDSILNGFICYILDNVYVSPDTEPNFGWAESTAAINKVSKTPLKTGFYMHTFGNNIAAYVMYISSQKSLKQYVVRIEVDLSKEKYNSSFVGESLFDKDIITDQIGTLYDWFGGHIKKFQHTYGSGLGWTHFFNQTEIVKEWKSEGRPILSGGFAKTTFPPDLQKFIAVILNNITISKKQLIGMDEDGDIDDKVLNKFFDDKNILYSEDTMWGAGKARHMIKVQIGYIEGTPAGPDHGVSFRQVGTKRFKGLNTDKIEISIYAYNPKRPGTGCHIWTLLTDLSINDFK